MKALRPSDLIDRHHEWSTLTQLWQSDRAELVIVTGRRRVGKSYLLARFSQSVEGLYYQATRRTERDQVAALARLVGEHFEDAALLEGTPFVRWEDLLGYLVRKVSGERLLLVLDEFPYLCEASPALPSIVQALLDHDLQHSKIKIVLSGSHISAMRRLQAADQPLYARRTAKLQILPFAASHVRDFLPGLEPQDALLTYGIFGGLPGHLALLDPSQDLPTNVARNLLSPSSRLFDEAEHMLDAFLGDAEVHYSILSAIASGQHTWSGITSRLGRSSGSLSRPMNWLIEMEIVQRVVPVTHDRPARSKTVLYRIADPYVQFWHRFVAPIVRSGASAWLSPEQLFEQRVAPHLNEYMGAIFEETCRAFVRHRWGGELIFDRIGEWWSHRGETQLDVVALTGSGELLVGECKWGVVDHHDLDRLRARAAELQRRTQAATLMHCVLFTARETADASLLSAQQGGSVRVVGAAELLGWPS